MMKKIKKYIILSSIFIIFNLIMSFIYLFFNIPYSIISVMLLVFYLLCFGILGYMIAKNSNKKGIVIGIITGLITMLILFSLSILFKNSISIKVILYYIIIILTIIFGSILAKNTKK